MNDPQCRLWSKGLAVVAAATVLLSVISDTPSAPCLIAEEIVRDAKADPVSDEDRRFWSFQKVSRPLVPAVKHRDRARSPIDAFILSRLEPTGLVLSADADRAALIRRIALDLVGLPPAPDIVDAFVADSSPDAYERLVDQLLASPQFGERWGRHWLDVAGYVDTVGFDVDADLIIASDGKWRYRDYVVRSFNDDKPYDRFLTEQLAGDELVDWRSAPTFSPEIRELLVATGFLRTAPDYTHEDVGNIPQNHFAVLHDTLEIVGSSVLGLTLNCARCHNHKFDPIPQEDYYRLMALFTPAYNPQKWKIVFPYDAKIEDRTLAEISLVERAKIERENAELERQAAMLTEQIEVLRRPHRDRLFEQKLARLPEPIRTDAKQAVQLPADKRNEIQKYLAGKFDALLKTSPEEIQQTLSESERQGVESLSQQIAAYKARRRTFGRIQALWDVGPPPPTRQLVRGNFETPADEVPPGFLRVLCEPGISPLAVESAPYAGTSGRRLALARWLTASDSRAAALTSRVMVNRVWQHLFGVGLVSTPENFGVGGQTPTHPELLEWLAADFVDGGWRVKPIIRSIVMSSVYRQSATGPDLQMRNSPAVGSGLPEEFDPDNRLLWRMRLKRLESEAIRDSVLAVSGCLNPEPGGTPILLEARPDGMIVISEKQLSSPAAKWRRTIYLLARRAFQLSELTVFDQPIVSTNCPERSRSAVPLQSLTMLNGALVWEQSERFADRILQQAPSDPAKQVSLVFRFALGRPPSADEAHASLGLIVRQLALYEGDAATASVASRKALIHLCHTLLNSSEFLYVP